MNEIVASLGGRKFVAFAVLSALFVGLFAFKAIDSDQLKGFLEWIFTVFVLGNVAQKFTTE